jgi:O-antigen ligase
MTTSLRKYSERLIALPIALVFINIAVQKGASDPLNPIKLWILGITAIWSLANLTTSHRTWTRIRRESALKQLSYLLACFVFVFFLAFLLTPVKSIGLLGDSGRNIGFLNYFFLAIVALYTALQINLTNVKVLYWTIFALSLSLSLYGFFQHLKIDFLKWGNLYNPIILTTGNPDFAASLLGLFTVFVFAGLFIDFSKAIKVLLSTLILFNILIIFWTQARQGLVLTAVGIGFLLLVFGWQKSKKLTFALFGAELLTGVLFILGTLQIGPLTSLVYKASINDRGYNWRAAIGMFKAHPFFGVGVDRYAAYFLQYRAPKYPLIYGYTQTVTNSHNVFLEILATAGIFAGIAYIALILFIAYRAYLAIRNSSGREQMMIAGIVAGWIVFVAQSIISVDSLVISIWGWVLGGAIVALSLKDLQLTNLISVGRRPKSVISRKGKTSGTASPYRGIVFAGSLVALCLIVVPMYRNETATARFSQIQSPTDPAGKDVYRAIAKKTFNQPLLNPNDKVNIALIMAKNGYVPEAITYFKETIKADPRNANSYSLLALVYENLKNPKEAIVYRKHLALLDPYGAENLVSLQKDYLLTGDKSSAIAIRDSILDMAPGTDVAKRAAGLITK